MTDQQIKKTHPKEIFNPALFWDAEDIDFEKHAGYIIARVLDYKKGVKYGNDRKI